MIVIFHCRLPIEDIEEKRAYLMREQRVCCREKDVASQMIETLSHAIVALHIATESGQRIRRLDYWAPTPLQRPCFRASEIENPKFI